MEWLIILGVLGAIALYGVSIYNALVRKRNIYQNAFAQIEVQLKRRYDLIPNLIETAKGYLKHERETLEAVIAARNAAANALKNAVDKLGPREIQAMAGAEQTLGSAMGQFNVVLENYPDLKADSNMRQLSEELTSTENRVARARQFYNDAVTDYNSYKQSFPPLLIANRYGHRADATLLEFDDHVAIQTAPKVSF